MERIELGGDRRTKTERRAGPALHITEALNAAMRHDQIEILYQPQFAAGDGSLVGAEGLTRWNHPELGEIGAEPLFGLAIRGDYLRSLSRHVMRTALSAAVGWSDRLRLSLNITAADLAEDDFPAVVADALSITRFAPERLTLEITEQSLLADLDGSAERLRELAALGVSIALDDFGAGFCNFRYLKRLPLHYLKLDRSMIEGIDEDPRDLSVLRGIVSMAHSLGLDVIAEGIEREPQRAVVVREGCAGWQGYLGARPMTASEFARLAN